MEIKRLAATFGRLEQEQLELEPGLNVIQAPNEAGKSTWTAFLRVMLYGLNTRDRSPSADKRRYLPWSGSAMEGVLEVTVPQGDVSIRRHTARANSPMGAFSAVYAGTSQPVEGLTAAGCGEALLGVPQEVFERSAYIRQTGLAVDQSRALEQRITALITTGEEDTSFTGAAEALRRQLNARRHNKTGLLPRNEEESAQLHAALSELEGLSAAAARDLDALDALQAALADAEEQLARHDAADQADQLRAVESARLDVASAHDRVKTLEASARNLPTRQELEVLQGRVEGLASTDWAVASAKKRLEAASLALRQAEDALAEHPFAGLTPGEAAAAPLDVGAKPSLPRWAVPAAALASVLLGGAIAFFTHLYLVAIGGGCGLFGAAMLALALPLRKRQEAWEANRAQLERRREEEAAAYVPLYEEEAKARTNYQAAQAAWEAVNATSKANLDGILSKLRAFRPLVRDLAEACQALDQAFQMREELERAQQREEQARRRWEALREAAPPIPTVSAVRPALSREQLRGRIAQLREQDALLRRQLHTTQGRIQALGDPAEMRLQLRALEERHARLQREYDAIALAAEVLFTANSALQTRFSPALGKHAAAIFTKLTGGRYNKVLLDRTMTPSAQAADQLLPHEAGQLSQGTADQLYLSVRLAICDLVLPEAAAVPVLLDDALVNFDDERMALALEYLVELSGRRQVLLFTCQRREADYLSWAYPGKFHIIKL